MHNNTTISTAARTRCVNLRPWKVKAILNGSTQMRVPLKRQPSFSPQSGILKIAEDGTLFEDVLGGPALVVYDDRERHIVIPYSTGDILIGRESWGVEAESAGPVLVYRADDAERRDIPIEKADRYEVGRWYPSIHMPRWASRITLEVTGVRVEEVQKISEADAVAEGTKSMAGRTIGNSWCEREAFSHLYDSDHGPGAWDRNEYVIVLEHAPYQGGA